MPVKATRPNTEPPLDGDIRRALVPLLPRLRRFCVGLCGNREDGDDLAQAAVARALAAEHQFEPGTRLDSWLFRIAQNLRLDQHRRIKTRGVEIDPDDVADHLHADGLQILEGRSDLAHVRDRFSRLPEEQRLVLSLVVIEGLSYREAADVLGIPAGTVMSRLSRARQALAQTLTSGSGQ